MPRACTGRIDLGAPSPLEGSFACDKRPPLVSLRERAYLMYSARATPRGGVHALSSASTSARLPSASRSLISIRTARAEASSASAFAFSPRRAIPMARRSIRQRRAKRMMRRQLRRRRERRRSLNELLASSRPLAAFGGDQWRAAMSARSLRPARQRADRTAVPVRTRARAVSSFEAPPFQGARSRGERR